MKRYKSGEALYARACESLVGGVNSPVRAWKSVGGTPLFFERGYGAMLRDTEGGEYRDYVCSWGPMILGHANADVVTAISRAAADSPSFGAPHTAEVELAEAVRARFPSIKKIRFVNSGTEATMAALRLARGFTGRDCIVKFDGNYHGHNDSLLVAAGSGALTFGVPTSPGITARTAHDTIVAPFNDLAAVRNIFEEAGCCIAAVIVEPWAGNMGLVPPAEGFLEGLRELTKSAGALLIFDEVITGFRVPSGGVQNAMKITPDLTCLGKIIGGGMPVGAFGGRAEIMDLLAPLGPVYQAGTLSGNPVAMAAGLATLKQLTPDLYDRLESLGARFEAGLRDAARSAGLPLAVSRMGSVLGLFFAEEAPANLAEVKAARGSLYPDFFHGMIARGNYFAPSAFEAAFISAAHTENIIDRTINDAKDVFESLAKKN